MTAYEISRISEEHSIHFSSMAPENVPENTETAVRSEPEHGSVVTPDIHSVAIKIQRAKDAYKDFVGVEEQPSNGEIILWYIYAFCSYFVNTVLIPIVFPLIISQTVPVPPPPPQGYNLSFHGLACNAKEMKLYQGLTYHSIEVSKHYSFTPLEWTALSWAIGIVLSAPILAFLSPRLDHGHSHNLIFGGATAIGALFCLPTGFFKVSWIFPPYVAIIVVASMVGFASHTRHLGVMVRGFSEQFNHHVSQRSAVGSWLSLHATAAGSLGAAIISAFTFHMLHHSEKLISLWIVSIFSGLKWMVGTMHAFSVNRPGATPIGTDQSKLAHVFAIFKYPHAVGSLIATLLSSFTSNCIFTGGMLYIMGQVCLKPLMVLFLWLIYFIFPLLSLPLLHPLQQLAKTDAVRMQLLGFFVTAVVSGLGYHYRNNNWQQNPLMILAAIQSTAAGILHAFSRVLILDCTPPRKEGSFSVWFAWVRAVGACAGFTVASVFPGMASHSFSVTFITSITAMLILVFGKVSNNGGAKEAGHVWEEETDKSEGNTSVQVEA